MAARGSSFLVKAVRLNKELLLQHRHYCPSLYYKKMMFEVTCRKLLSVWALILLVGIISARRGAHAFAPAARASRRHATQSCLYAKEPSDVDDWDEKFKGDPEMMTPSDRMKNRQNQQAINDRLEELDEMAAKRPTIPGDYDWDEAYKDDPDWITGDQVPGKMKMTDEQIQAQESALNALADKWTSDGYETSQAPPEEVHEDT